MAEVGRPSSGYSHFAKAAAHYCGRPRVFVLAVAVIAVWIVTGPLFGFSDTWQLVINTGTTIDTFLMVFLIQNTQNRDSRAVHLKLDELIRASNGARNAFVNLENLPDPQLCELQEQFEKLQREYNVNAAPHLEAIETELRGRRAGKRHHRSQSTS